MYQIDLSILLNRALGIAAGQVRRYNVGPGSITESDPVVFEDIDIQVLDSTRTSVLGTPIISPAAFKGGRYPIKDDAGQIQYVTYLDYELPAPTIIRVEMPKIIERTRIAGRAGSVKELISDDDFMVSFRGFLINSDGEGPPELAIRDFREITGVPQSLSVECELFDWLGIDELTIFNATCEQYEAHTNVYLFTIDAWSDQPVEVKLRDGL